LVREQDFASLTYILFSANGKDIIDENNPLYDRVVEEFESTHLNQSFLTMKEWD
jgi:hypothetical protein